MVHPRLLLVILLFAASCVTPSEPRSPVRVERSWGFAGGENEEEAQRLATLVEEVLEYYRSLEGFTERPLRAHFADKLVYDKVAGVKQEPFLGEPWIAVTRDGKNVENILAHEMAHFYFEDVHRRFPTVLEEGVCELLAGQVYPAPEQQRSHLCYVAASYLDSFVIEVRDAEGKAWLPFLVQPVPSVEEVFDIGWYENFHGDPRVNATLYGLGWLIADRIGWEGILQLAIRCREEGLETVPPEWIRAAAGIEPPTQEKLRAAILGGFGVEAGDEGELRLYLGSTESGQNPPPSESDGGPLPDPAP